MFACVGAIVIDVGINSVPGKERITDPNIMNIDNVIIVIVLMINLMKWESVE